MAARKVSTAMFRMPFRREEEELCLVDWYCEHCHPLRWLTSSTRTPLHCCKVWQQFTGDRCLSKRIIHPRSVLLREPVLLLFLAVSVWYMVNSMRLQMHPGIYNLPDWLTLEDLGLRAAREHEECQCQNVNEKKPVEGARRGPYLQDGKRGESKANP